MPYDGDGGGLAGRGCELGDGCGDGAREVDFGLCAAERRPDGGLLTSSAGLSSCISVVLGLECCGEVGLPLDADADAEVPVPESETAKAVEGAGTAAGKILGEVRGETFRTGLDNLEPPEVLATVFGPPVATLPGLEAREEGADSGESRFMIADDDDDAAAAAEEMAATFTGSLSEAEPSEAELAEYDEILPFVGGFAAVLEEGTAVLFGSMPAAA